MRKSIVTALATVANSWKARCPTEELAQLEFGLDEEDALLILAGLTADDIARRIESEQAPEWLYVFRPEVAGVILYVKLIVRPECVVVSFHEDEGKDDEEA